MHTAQSTHLDKDRIFIICAEEDKDYIITLQKNLRSRGIKVWSMFADDGTYSSGLGDDHLQRAIEELEKSCVAVLLISEHSIRKGSDKASFIYREISNFYNIVSNNKCLNMRLLPLCINENYFAKLPESWLPFGINSFKISTVLKLKNSPDGMVVDDVKLNHVCNEISSKYFECLNANYRYILEHKYMLVTLGNKLMQSNDTIVKTISEDIRQTDENDSDSLYAMHVISNEINEYDCNAYSLMIISSNLLGDADDGMLYDPAHRGVKYYYYCPQSYLETVEADYRNRLEAFIRRNNKALEYAENSMRAHHVVSEKINSYLLSIFNNNNNGIKADLFLNMFSVSVIEYKEPLLELVERYDGDFYDSYTETLSLPNSFYKWLFGGDDKFNEDVFDFINKLVEFLQSTSVHNKAAVDKLADCEKKLTNLQYFHKFLSRKTADIPEGIRFKSVAKKVIGLKNDQNNNLIKRWVIDRDDSDEWDVQDVDAVVEQALQNVKFIPIKDTYDFVPCNSFAVFEHRDKRTGKRRKELVWYSTAHNFVETSEKVFANDEQEMLVILNEDTNEDEINIVKQTLEYLKNIKAIDSFCEF